MQVHTALSQVPLTENALEDVCREIIARLGGRSVDLAFAFFSPDHSDSADLIVKTIHDRLHPTVLLGCSAESVIGDGAGHSGDHAIRLHEWVFDAVSEAEP